MSDPLAFTSTSPRHGLPFLFLGQSQKEFTVNQAHALIDMLLHPAIGGEAAMPPASPEEGECWLVGAGASGDWSGHQGEIAGYQPGGWLFAAPREGMRLFNRASGQLLLHAAGAWQAAPLPPAPAGGSTVDAEARSAIAGLVSSLQQAGILPAA